VLKLTLLPVARKEPQNGQHYEITKNYLMQSTITVETGRVMGTTMTRTR
jgi:hypothetical protein